MEHGVLLNTSMSIHLLVDQPCFTHELRQRESGLVRIIIVVACFERAVINVFFAYAPLRHMFDCHYHCPPSRGITGLGKVERLPVVKSCLLNVMEYGFQRIHVQQGSLAGLHQDAFFTERMEVFVIMFLQKAVCWQSLNNDVKRSLSAFVQPLCGTQEMIFDSVIIPCCV